mmetsp:Transcript_4408/g.12712  ORF Transcript_4408/g.12712 Transcript_4408/m.12712 type:complete len:258 (+) Transcript_4408:112-885(+)
MCSTSRCVSRLRGPLLPWSASRVSSICFQLCIESNVIHHSASPAPLAAGWLTLWVGSGLQAGWRGCSFSRVPSCNRCRLFLRSRIPGHWCCPVRCGLGSGGGSSGGSACRSGSFCSSRRGRRSRLLRLERRLAGSHSCGTLLLLGALALCIGGAPGLGVRAGQGSHVRSDGSREGTDRAPLDAIPPLQRTHHSALAAQVGDLHDLVRQPLVLLLGDADVAEVDVVLLVGIEAGADEDDVRFETHHCRQDLVSPGTPP